MKVTLLLANALLLVLACSTSAKESFEFPKLLANGKQSEACALALIDCGSDCDDRSECCDALSAATKCLDDAVAAGSCLQSDVEETLTALDFAADTLECGPDCFPSTARFFLENGSVVAASELQTGDRVMSSVGKYSEIFFFSHQDLDSHHIFVKILLSGGKSLTLSRGHLVPVDGKLVEARKVHQGDQLTLATGAKDVVSSVELVQEVGLINPHTADGTVIVNGVQASCYTSGVQPRLASVLLFPVKVAYNLGLPTGNPLRKGSPAAARLLSFVVHSAVNLWSTD